jgi:hypothetical protein
VKLVLRDCRFSRRLSPGFNLPLVTKSVILTSSSSSSPSSSFCLEKALFAPYHFVRKRHLPHLDPRLCRFCSPGSARKRGRPAGKTTAMAPKRAGKRLSTPRSHMQEEMLIVRSIGLSQERGLFKRSGNTSGRQIFCFGSYHSHVWYVPTGKRRNIQY